MSKWYHSTLCGHPLPVLANWSIQTLGLLHQSATRGLHSLACKLSYRSLLLPTQRWPGWVDIAGNANITKWIFSPSFFRLRQRVWASYSNVLTPWCEFNVFLHFKAHDINLLCSQSCLLYISVVLFLFNQSWHSSWLKCGYICIVGITLHLSAVLLFFNYCHAAFPVVDHII